MNKITHLTFASFVILLQSYSECARVEVSGACLYNGRAYDNNTYIAKTDDIGEKYHKCLEYRCLNSKVENFEYDCKIPANEGCVLVEGDYCCTREFCDERLIDGGCYQNGEFYHNGEIIKKSDFGGMCEVYSCENGIIEEHVL
ncbi:CLUMA_CG004643, isoform A [Clunio marinus]|uniref:CLUMA_CG004643, isoform A n=1 Tax=Clunio marinus TaxID=568069 RepID=A0A1J1HTR9_9DIPT|nr:CLUMA_CG004643, isoform A [Clunio marinus]